MWHNIEQNTDEWLVMRSGHLTGSAIAKVMANGDRAFGDPAKRLAVDIALEQIKGAPVNNGYTNADMDRGHIQEPIARQLYQSEYFTTVSDGGFFDNGFTGCSPDGLVGESGVIEIKSVIPSVQYKRIKSGTFDPAYKWQLIFNLKESGREWIDYISFCTDFTDGKKLFVQRIYANRLATAFDQVNKRVSKFILLVDQVRAEIGQ